MTVDNANIDTIDQLMQHPRDRPRVIFCDWHGVLCHKPYWHSITEDPEHPLHAILTRELDRLFTTGNRDGRDWMCGKRSSRDILTRLATQHRHLPIGPLLTQLADDITRMPVDQRLLQTLHRARIYATVVLATDNIDMFTSVFRTASLGRIERPSGMATLLNAAAAFDNILSSSDTGVLKSEDPQSFFSPWLTKAGLSFTDALLIDDRTDNCAAFELQAGVAIELSQ